MILVREITRNVDDLLINFTIELKALMRSKKSWEFTPKYRLQFVCNTPQEFRTSFIIPMESIDGLGSIYELFNKIEHGVYHEVFDLVVVIDNRYFVLKSGLYPKTPGGDFFIPLGMRNNVRIQISSIYAELESDEDNPNKCWACKLPMPILGPHLLNSESFLFDAETKTMDIPCQLCGICEEKISSYIREAKSDIHKYYTEKGKSE